MAFYFAPTGKTLSCAERRPTHDTQDSIVCHTPLNNLGFSRKGSARTFSVTFQALRAGLYEVRALCFWALGWELDSGLRHR